MEQGWRRAQHEACSPGDLDAGFIVRWGNTLCLKGPTVQKCMKENESLQNPVLQR